MNNKLRKNNIIGNIFQCCGTGILTLSVLFLIGGGIKFFDNIFIWLGMIGLALWCYALAEIIQILHDIRLKLLGDK